MSNAANPKQQRAIGRTATKRLRRYMEALRAVMGTPEGTLVLMDRELGLVARAGVNKSVFASDPILMANLAGRQDFGHELLALLSQADEERLLAMDAETRGLAQRDAAELEAATGKGDSES